MRAYPGVSLKKTYDHEKGPWYVLRENQFMYTVQGLLYNNIEHPHIYECRHFIARPHHLTKREGTHKTSLTLPLLFLLRCLYQAKILRGHVFVC